MVGWHHQLNRHEFEQTPGDSEELGMPGVLQPMGLQRAGHDLVTEKQQQSCDYYIHKHKYHHDSPLENTK